MRTTLTLLLGACASIANAQLINGSFEDGLNGWIVPDCQVAANYPQGAPGAGDQCLSLEIVSDLECQYGSPVHQFVPWMTPGPWVLKGWIAGAALVGQTAGCYIDLSMTQHYSTPIISLDGWGHEWSYIAREFTLDADVPVDSLRINLFQDQSNFPLLNRFDGIELVPALSTATGTSPEIELSFRPNPAVDRVFVDLAGSPLSVSAIDAGGRVHDLGNFLHRGRTLEVDVHALAPGICLLRVTTASGTYAIRFVKA